jgi:hypothetical protein
VHKPDQIELIPPSYFTKSELLDGDNNLVSDIVSALSLSQSSKNHTLASERRPTFAFHRRIRDDPAFKIEIPDNHQQWFPAAMKQVGNAIFCLVQEWTKEWLSGTHSSVDTELRLKGMIEEVIWGNAIWYGVGGWVSRGDDGRATNADFFLSVPSSYVLSTTADFSANTWAKCTPRHLIHLPTKVSSQRRSFINLFRIQSRWRANICQSFTASPDVSFHGHRMEDYTR